MHRIAHVSEASGVIPDDRYYLVVGGTEQEMIEKIIFQDGFDGDVAEWEDAKKNGNFPRIQVFDGRGNEVDNLDRLSGKHGQLTYVVGGDAFNIVLIDPLSIRRIK